MHFGADSYYVAQAGDTWAAVASKYGMCGGGSRPNSDSDCLDAGTALLHANLVFDRAPSAQLPGGMVISVPAEFIPDNPEYDVAKVRAAAAATAIQPTTPAPTPPAAITATTTPNVVKWIGWLLVGVGVFAAFKRGR